MNELRGKYVATNRREWSYVAIWEFLVKGDCQAQFEAVYGPKGEWAIFFEQDPAYCGTDLVRDVQNNRRYVTLDYWNSRQAYEEFRSKQAAGYREIDARCESLTERETNLGGFDRLSTG